ncbi:leucine-rich repeat protein [Pseudoflavonifractor sp.]|jgi:hypothetical protein|uniref:leucine-rich repeat protein n=1 Tax=Pseudoflavonifractor sp. TaxID=1980281 RepID=UPI003D8CFED6
MLARRCKKLTALFLTLCMVTGMLGTGAVALEGDSGSGKWWWDTTGEAQEAYEAYEASMEAEQAAYDQWDAAYDALDTAKKATEAAKAAYDAAKAELDAMEETDEGYAAKAAEVAGLEAAWDTAKSAEETARTANQEAYDAYTALVTQTNGHYSDYLELAEANYPYTGVLDAENKTLTIAVSGDMPEGAEAVFEGYFVMQDSEGSRGTYSSVYASNIQDNVTKVVLGDGFTGIAGVTFSSWRTLTEVVLPESLTSIGDSAFSSCTGLVSIDLSNVKTIGASAFYGAFDAAADVDIVLDGAAVGNTAFRKANIDTLVATDLTAVGNQAFIQCPTLTEVTFSVADGAELYAEGAFFYQNKALTKATVSGECMEKNIFRECTALTDVTLTGMTAIGPYAFYQDTALKTVTLPEGVTSIGNMAFKGAGLETINIPASLDRIEQEAFMNCASLTGDFDLTGLSLVGWNAFTGCTGVTSVTVSDGAIVEHSSIFSGDSGVLQGWEGRMLAILDGKFQLDETVIEAVEPQGWTSSKVGRSNDTTSYDGGTQITKEARWASDTVADVLLQAYYTDEAQMDFVFLIDTSNSITQSGSGYDLNARLYDMQSKLMDVSEALLTTDGYDCKVAFTTFGATSTSSSGGFLSSMDDVTAFVENINTYYENTNYILGLNNAKALVDSNTGRNTTVIFLSDGQPNTDADGGKVESVSTILPAITAAAQAIQNSGVQIYGVLQSVTGEAAEAARDVMAQVCTENMVFTSTDTESFSAAVNNAIGAAYTTYTLTDVVGDDFDLVDGSIRTSAGTAVYDEDTRTITWTITGMPYTVHTLTFQEQLKQVDGSYPYGTFDTNKGDAELKLGDDPVNGVETPELTRTTTPVVTYDYYTVTVNYLDKATGEKIADSYTAPSRIEGSRYDVSEYDAIAIDGYTYDSTGGDPLTGVLNSNKVVNVYYTADETDIDEGDTPTTDLPDLPDEGGEDVDIGEGDTPTTDLPDLPDEGGEEVDIGEGGVPTGNLPQTGTTSNTVVLRVMSGVFLCLAVFFGGVTVVLIRKEREQA